jgi:predicted transcriptional regulator
LDLINHSFVVQAALVDAVQSPVSMYHKDYRGTKRVHFDALKSHGELRDVVRQRTGGKNALDRSKLRTAISKVCILGRKLMSLCLKGL